MGHTQGDRESQVEQEQVTRQVNKKELRKEASLSDLSFVLSRCEALGIAKPVLEVLLERYSLERIERQLSWLPARKPRDPAALFVRAVQEDWALPAQYDPEKAQEIWQVWLKAVAVERQDREEGKESEGKDEAQAPGDSGSAQQELEP